jgi:hypothetical protein
MAKLSYEVRITLATEPGVRLATAVVIFYIPLGILILNGFSVVQQHGKEPGVEFPQNEETTRGKYLPVVEAVGPLQDTISAAILDAYMELFEE